ncbi:hypothetical protein GUITHDRAFT_117704 [Guillardia theta CCMP2712]|uniref:Uncharacterized protein n=1 Tax=Guillardia theta (strain CCMP2712) TaxID=905079 RepID=L1IF20_GUITC|nr:hypothetical protein GUITHDRAFT_119024 [Guillardia theta CCMP2712]XP_005823162.1 hypothetical protein GUITHDRAFT_117704 [Guillardia theta CCMP2712]EKX34841.1 hypothetical protein GUITHDRAFT_119024 [Guillardia theta CCMP2712]EKX36182.1 hypothetical protein GUITHDRAFT_117704 [Guillardia theta CCMP2712]|eukprot:XP_005821821.1 hypothetical protein GUITHDRAFT_119024 [Guillardia theta CCMP2712]
MATSCIDLWNHDMNVLNHYTDILNKNNELEDPYAREALRIEKKIARNNIPIPLYRMLVNAINNFPMLKYHVRASIEKLEKIHDCLYHIKYEGTERDCMRRSAEMILELYAKLGVPTPGALNLYINEAADHITNPQVVASTDSETWVQLNRDRLASAQWILTPRHPYIGGNEQSIIDFRDIAPLRHRANVACYKIVGKYARTITSALRHILTQNSQIKTVVLEGVGMAPGYHHRFKSKNPRDVFPREAARRVREEVEGELLRYDVNYEFR